MALIILSIIFLFIIALVIIGLRANVIDWGSPVINVIDGLFRLFLRYYHRFEFDPVEFPEQGGALLASNHISGLDPFLILGACKRPVRFMIAREEYERFGLRWLFRATGCIPVDRSAKPEMAFREALAALREGEVIGIFPEGGIHDPDAPPKRLKRGVAVMAELTGVAVYPVKVSGIAAEGEVVRAIVRRANARLRTFPAIDCTSTGQKICLENLGLLLRDKEE